MNRPTSTSTSNKWMVREYLGVCPAAPQSDEFEDGLEWEWTYGGSQDVSILRKHHWNRTGEPLAGWIEEKKMPPWK